MKITYDIMPNGIFVYIGDIVLKFSDLVELDLFVDLLDDISWEIKRDL